MKNTTADRYALAFAFIATMATVLMLGGIAGCQEQRAPQPVPTQVAQTEQPEPTTEQLPISEPEVPTADVAAEPEVCRDATHETDPVVIQAIVDACSGVIERHFKP